jgi:hypothetical protein
VADSPDPAREFEQAYGWSWSSIVDPERARAGSLGAAYQPVVILIDEHGRIVARHVGGGDQGDWEALAAQLD